jgi:hypothetical protein
MAQQAKQPPILAAAFAAEGQLQAALGRLAEREIAPDFIGAYVSDDGDNRHGLRDIYLLSVLAPSRLHEDIKASFQQCGALSVGSAAEMRAAYGVVPHPGVLEHREMKLPTGHEYHQLVSKGRKKG